MTMERSLNKVYINPNFNQRPHISTSPLLTQNNLYVNPYFSQVNQQSNFDQTLNLTKRRIFVNPNFIRPNNEIVPNFSGSNLYYEPQFFSQKDVKNYSNDYNKQIMPILNIKENPESKPSTNVTKSRYTLIRKNVCAANVETIAKKSTVKISKYKTMRLSFIKNNIIDQEPKKAEVKLQATTYRSRLLSKYNYVTKTIYQNSSVNRTYIKINKQTPTVKKLFEVKSTNIKTPKAKKTLLSPNVSVNRGTVAKRFKKNNIPCQLFTKYGKCLRNIRGNCEFLHEKKHVSICRKFLKGICHDPSCLLSHELSAKKMPTCYFYLNGRCTKNNCPYLHVKLNNKTKLCNNFLKGYCENGDKCVYRHVNKELKMAIKKNMNQQRRFTCSSPVVVTNKIKLKTALKKSDETIKSVAETECGQNKEDVNCRYFKNDNQENEQNQVCDVIKPSRCKLGTLPSFIKL